MRITHSYQSVGGDPEVKVTFDGPDPAEAYAASAAGQAKARNLMKVESRPPRKPRARLERKES